MFDMLKTKSKSMILLVYIVLDLHKDFHKEIMIFEDINIEMGN